MKKKVFAISFWLLCFSASLCAKTVRVGYFKDSRNFMSGFSEEDPRCGYAYEYLQTVSSYTGWSYEYVYGDWETLYPALQRGEIDLLPGVTKDNDRTHEVLFPECPMGRQSYNIYSHDKNFVLNVGDYEALSGKTLVLRSDYSYYNSFLKWKKDKNLNMKYIEVSSSDSYLDVLKEGKADLVLELDIIADPEWNPVCIIGDSDFYFAVSRNRTDLLSELNTALSEIFASNPYYNNTLWMKYFSNIGVAKTLSSRELEWLNENPVINVGCLENYLPYSTFNEDENCPEGLVIEVLENLSKTFSLENLNFAYHFYSDFKEMVSDLKQGKLQFVAPVLKSLEWAENNDLILTETLTTYGLGLVFMTGQTMNAQGRVAIPAGGINGNFIEEMYPGLTVHEYQTFEECLDAILDKEAEYCVMNIYKVRSLLNKNRKYKKLTYVELGTPCEQAGLAARKDTALISLLNKYNMRLGKHRVDSVTEKYAVLEEAYTKRNFFKDYLGVFLSVLFIVIFITIALMFALTRIFFDIEHDALTQLLNRKKLDKYITRVFRRAEDKDECFCLLLFDLDNFKVLNDTYGHFFGDTVLKTVADIIRKSISCGDAAFRWGGEEFLIICRGEPHDLFFKADSIRKTIADTQLRAGDFDVNITVTIGLSSYKKGTTYIDMFRQADDNMYKGKQNGKNQVVL